MITDRFQRIHNYLRISLTDVCNLRCAYCMPEDKSDFFPAPQLMQVDEIDAIASLFVKLGVNKIRLTGGEPLVRKDFTEILQRLQKHSVELTLTTNGIHLDRYLGELLNAGVRSVNISLDTLKPERFHHITRRPQFEKVWNNIQLAMNAGLHVKVNVVAMQGVNDDEVNDFVRLTKTMPLHVRFIEFMPFAGNQWAQASVITADDLLNQIGREFTFQKLEDALHDTARKFQAEGHAGTFAIIATMSHPFCSGCNRMRLTADGRMKNCLFSTGEVDLLSALRKGEDLEPLIRQCVIEKHAERGGQFPEDFHQTRPDVLVNRSMIEIGG